MPATIIKLNSALTVSNGQKIKFDVLDTDQTALLHDFSKVATFPAQTGSIPNGTALGNLATTNALKVNSFQARISNIVYNQAGKCINIDGSLGGTSDELDYGAIAAPFPQLINSAEVTDMLFTLWVKINTSAAASGVIGFMDSTRTTGASGVFNAQWYIYFGLTAGKITLFILGQQVTIDVPFVSNTWLQLGFYVRANTYNNKAGLIRVYKNGVSLGDITTGIPNAWFTTDNTKKFILGGEYGGFFGSIGRVAVLKAIDAASLSPDALVAGDYAYGSAIWT